MSSSSARRPSTRSAAGCSRTLSVIADARATRSCEIQTILRAAAENLTDKQWTRLFAAIDADPAHDEVLVAWQCAQQLRSAYHQKDLAEGRRIAMKVVESFHTCPIPEIARLGRTLRRWRSAFLAYFTTSRANNGGTEAVNGIIELHRRRRTHPMTQGPGKVVK